MKKKVILVAGYLTLSCFASLRASEASFVLISQAGGAASSIAEGAEHSKEQIDFLGQAVMEGNLAQVKELLSKGASVNARFSAMEAGEQITCLTLFHLAAHAPIDKQAEIVEELGHRNAPVNQLDSKEMSPLHYAILWQADDVVEALLKVQGILCGGKDVHQRTPLHIAAIVGSPCAIELLLPHGSVNAIDEEQNSPLHLASLKGHKECVTALCEAGASIDSKNAYKRTPLFLATMGKEFPVIMELLKHGADPYLEDSEGKTPNTYWIEEGLLIMPRNENPPSTVRKWAEESKLNGAALKQAGPSGVAKAVAFFTGAGICAAAVVLYLKHQAQNAE